MKRLLSNCMMLLLLFTAIFPAQAQQAPSVTGIVQTESGERMPGVSVKAVSESKKVQMQATDEKGAFRFQELIAGERYSFFFSSVGFQTKQLDGYLIKKGETVNLIVRMKLRDDSLSQVIVVGYGTQKKNNVTGAISQVGSEVFENRPVTNIAQGLQGALPNLNITFDDTRIGRGGNFNIRGFTSINGGSPLILIDGTPGDINLINPEDVATVTILKDAASAAIYGARAAFGVVLVTTRKGKSGGLQVRYTSNYGWSNPTRLPKVISDPLAAATLQNDAFKAYNGADAGGMPDVIAYLKRRQEDPSLPELGVDAAGNFIRGANTDWYGEFYNEGQPFMKHYLSLSGGKENTNYFFSAGYLRQEGAFKVATDNYKQYSARFKVNSKLASWLTVYDNAEVTQGTYDAPNKVIANGFNVYRYLSLFANPYEAIRTPGGNYTQAGMLTFGQLEKGGRSVQRQLLLKNTVGFNTSFLDNALQLNGDYTLVASQDRNNTQNLRLSYESKPGVISNYSNPDFYQSEFANNNHHIVNLYASYERAFGAHQVKALAGYNQEYNGYTYTSARRDDNITPSLGGINLTTGIATVGDRQREWATRGYFARINYSFRDRYLLELNGRYDGSSRFPDSTRFGFFPSVSAGWIVSRENFFQPLRRAVNSFKLRASYGSLGNQLISEYGRLATMTVGKTTDILDGVQQLYTRAPGLVPLNFTWETASTLDFGADLSMLKNRLDIGFDWYQRNTRDMLVPGRTLPAVLGTSSPRQNAADLATKGWELSMKWHDEVSLGGRPFTYYASAVLADSRSFITKFDNPSRFLGDYYVGQEIGEIWGYHTLGFFATDEEYKDYGVDQKKVQSLSYSLNGHPMAGDIKFADRNGDKVIDNGQNTVDDPGDMYKIGNSSPRYSYGIGLGASWRGISLDVFLQGVGKRDFWPGVEAGAFWGFYNRWNQPVYEHIYNNYWTPENPDAYFPRPRAYDALNNTRQLGVTQTRYLQDANYLRVKNISLGYMLPEAWLHRVKLRQARIFFSGQNLFEFTRLSKALDPEGLGDRVDNDATNGNGYVYPVQRTYTFGLEINL